MKQLVLVLILSLTAGMVRAQDSLSVEELARIKAATVFIKVGSPRSGSIATGSGFIVKVDGNTGWVVTNHHVIDLYEDDDETRMMQTPISVVIESGTENERSVKATIVAIDPVNDLATLKLEKVEKLPAPLTIDDTLEVRETMQVYVCGFPFGGRLAIGTKNPEISIGDAKVSSLRREIAGGPIAKVQLNGALNPGNSGGPVVAPNGKLVGVAVTTVRNAGIGYAIPFHEVTSMLKGRLGVISISPKSEDVPPNGPIEAVLRTRVIDPFRLVKSVTAHILPGTGTLPKDNTNVLPNAMKVPLPIQSGVAKADVTVPADSRMQMFVQIEIETANGKVFTNAIAVVVAPPRPEMPNDPGPSRRYGPQRTPDGRLKLTSGSILPFPSIPPQFPTPSNSENVSIVNASPDLFVGKSLRMDVLSTCVVNPAERGEYELVVETEADNIPSELRIVVPKDLALQIADLGIPELLPAVAQIKYPLRLMGAVEKPSGRESRHSFLVSAIDFLDDDGKTVSTFQASAAPPAGTTTLSTLNRFPESFVGKTVTVEGFINGTRYAGGTGLEIRTNNLTNPLNLENYTSRSLAGQVESDIAKADLPARVRLTIEVKAIHGRTNKGVIGIQQVEVLNDENQVSKTLKSNGSIEYPKIPSQIKSSPPKSDPKKADENKETSESQKSAPAADPGMDKTTKMIMFGSGLLLVGGVILFVFVLRKPKTTAKAPTEKIAKKYESKNQTTESPRPIRTKPKGTAAREQSPNQSDDDNPFSSFGK